MYRVVSCLTISLALSDQDLEEYNDLGHKAKIAATEAAELEQDSGILSSALLELPPITIPSENVSVTERLTKVLFDCQSAHKEIAELKAQQKSLARSQDGVLISFGR